MKEPNTCNILNVTAFHPLISENLLDGFLLMIAIINSIASLFSIGWLAYIGRKTVSLKRELKCIGGNTRDVEVCRNRYNIQTQLNRNLLMLCILVVEALHLIIKGIGFGLFFVFEKLNETEENFIISSNLLNSYKPVRDFRYFPITLVRVGISNGFLLFFMVLLSNLMIYLIKAYGEHKNYKTVRLYFIFGLVQFLIVLVTMSAIQTALLGSLIVTLFSIMDYVILIRSRNRLVWALKKWRFDGGYYEDKQTYRNRSKYLLSFKKWTRALLISLSVYLISVLADNAGNWIIMIAPNPCFVERYYGLALPIPSELGLTVILNLAYFLFVLANLGTLQFDLFLFFSNLVYYITTHCYFTTPSRDRAIREKVSKMIWKMYNRPLMSNYSNN